MERGRTEHHSEWLTRKRRIDPRLDALGWSCLRPGSANRGGCHRTEEEETDNGPADYALWLDGDVVGVVEAKKLTLGPQNVLVQAERYARGRRRAARSTSTASACPFLYSTNGEVIWFHDVRHPLNRSRRVADFHTPAALRGAARPRLRRGVRAARRDTRTTTRGCGPTRARPTPPSSRRSPSASGRCSSRWRPAPARRSRSSTRSTG